MIVNRDQLLTLTNTKALGTSCAISGNTFVSGSLSSNTGGVESSGAADVFIRPSDSSPWVHQARLNSSNPKNGGFFGLAVAMDGDTVAVGARFEDVGTHTNAGRVYVFERSETNWTLTHELVHPDPASDGANAFGSDLALKGNQLIVISVGNTTLFTKGTGTWSGTVLPSSYGGSCDISGDTVIVGNNGSKTVNVLTKEGDDWSLQATLRNSNPTVWNTNDLSLFGHSCSIDGNTIVVGDTRDTTHNVRGGALYVFTRTGTTWSQEAKLFPTTVWRASTGTKCKIRGDELMVTATMTGAAISTGSAYYYTRTGTTWSFVSELKAPGNPVQNSLGISVDFDSKSALVGDWNFPRIGDDQYGSIHSFFKSSIDADENDVAGEWSDWTLDSTEQVLENVSYSNWGVTEGASTNTPTVVRTKTTIPPHSIKTETRTRDVTVMGEEDVPSLPTSETRMVVEGDTTSVIVTETLPIIYCQDDEPSSGRVSDLWYETDTKKLYINKE